MTKLSSIKPIIEKTAKIKNAVFGVYTYVDERARVTDSSMGDYSYVLHDSEIIYSSIGKFCAIAPFVRINPGNHPYWRPAMANFTYRSHDYGLGENDQEFFDYRKSQKVNIGHDVWIGQHSLIMPNTTVGVGAVVGGGAVVTKDVPPYAIVGGVPAKIIRYRFEPVVVQSLLRIQWWNWTRSQLEERIRDLRINTTEFCKKI
jgi:phosphonate metabolism protein (transferase hexapeptide repeat family)